MTLLIQVIGVLLLAAALGALVGHKRASVSAVARYTGLIGVVLMGVAAIDNLYPTTRQLLRDRPGLARLPAADYLGAGGSPYGAREDFLAWVDGRIPRHASVYLARPEYHGQEQWVTWRLTPRRFMDRPQQADWVIFYGDKRASAAVPRDLLWNPKRFEPGLAIARVRR